MLTTTEVFYKSTNAMTSKNESHAHFPAIALQRRLRVTTLHQRHHADGLITDTIYVWICGLGWSAFHCKPIIVGLLLLFSRRPTCEKVVTLSSTLVMLKNMHQLIAPACFNAQPVKLRSIDQNGNKSLSTAHKPRDAVNHSESLNSIFYTSLRLPVIRYSALLTRL